MEHNYQASVIMMGLILGILVLVAGVSAMYTIQDKDKPYRVVKNTSDILTTECVNGAIHLRNNEGRTELYINANTLNTTPCVDNNQQPTQEGTDE